VRLGAALAAALCCAAADAAEIEVLDIDHASQRYRMHLIARLDTPLQRSFAVLRDCTRACASACGSSARIWSRCRTSASTATP
jgi:hypothetical protein